MVYSHQLVLNITEKNYDSNANGEPINEIFDYSNIQVDKHIQTVLEECNDSEDQGKSSKAEENLMNKRGCIDILDDEQNVIHPEEEYQSINFHKSIILEDRFNPWTRQSLYEIPEENEDETSLENNSFLYIKSKHCTKRILKNNVIIVHLSNLIE